jgi:hypothetical protein
MLFVLSPPRATRGLISLICLSIVWLPSQSVSAATPAKVDRLPVVRSKTAAAVAEKVDAVIEQQLSAQGVTPTGIVSDEDFLRRVSLDLAGRIPTPEEVTLFVLSPATDKRSRMIDQLLTSTDFSRTWAAYWREVIFSRATDQRARISQPVFEDWMAGQLAAGTPWDAIVTKLLTATGNTREEGATALIFAHGGDPAEIASEASRIFLGMQIQCANCHDHPYDQWKRQDFHELAAFFPRIRLRRDMSTQPATFIVESANDVRDSSRPPLDPEMIFRFLDRNRDGKLTQTEARQNRQFRDRFERLVEFGDKNGDGAISRAELKEVPKPNLNEQPGRGSAEYYMPDLENPTERGTRTQPVFFVSDDSVPLGTDDLDRREALSDFMTSSDNPWFARAFVNRICGTLLGSGFYNPIDDIGPERSAEYAEALDLLAAGFIANRYDIAWLYRTITHTRAYQRALLPQTDEASPPAFAAASLIRLRGEQVQSAVLQVVGRMGMGSTRPGGFRANRPGQFGAQALSQLFNYDPSLPQEDVLGDIPQALFLMNSPIVNLGISGRGPTVLGDLLRRFSDDREALSELYLRVLSRMPTDAELAICQEHIAAAADRTQAFEDILWSLLNSSEFLSRR